MAWRYRQMQPNSFGKLWLLLFLTFNRQPKKRSEYQTLVLHDRPFGNELAVSFCRRCASLHLCAYDFHCSIQKRRGKQLGRNVSFNESHVLYIDQTLWYDSSLNIRIAIFNIFMFLPSLVNQDFDSILVLILILLDRKRCDKTMSIFRESKD